MSVIEVRKTWGGTGLEERFKSSLLKVLNLRCLWESQLEMQVIRFVLSLEARGEVLTNLVSLAHRL